MIPQTAIRRLNFFICRPTDEMLVVKVLRLRVFPPDLVGEGRVEF